MIKAARIAAALAAAAAAAAPCMGSGRDLVVYYSLDVQQQPGVDATSAATPPDVNTADVAKYLAQKEGAGLYRLEPFAKYPAGDRKAMKQKVAEISENPPSAASADPDLSGCSTVYFAIPKWEPIPPEASEYIKRNRKALENCRIRVVMTSRHSEADKVAPAVRKAFGRDDIGDLLVIRQDELRIYRQAIDAWLAR
ncbi:MAG: hypothetical protein ACI4NA_03070 [Succinivibrio sp.]